MKLLVLCSVLIVHLLSPTSGLKCYGCDDSTEGLSCKNRLITTCGVNQSQSYCGKFNYVGTKYRFQYCNGNCSIKVCMPLKLEQVCKLSNTFELPRDPDFKSATAFCCQGDLCNSSGKLSNRNKALFYAVVFSFVYSLVCYL